MASAADGLAGLWQNLDITYLGVSSSFHAFRGSSIEKNGLRLRSCWTQGYTVPSEGAASFSTSTTLLNLGF